MRDRLIELLTSLKRVENVNAQAKYILNDNWIRMPFKIGQKVWYTSRPRRKENIFSVKVIYITHTDVGFIISVENEYGHRFEMDAEDLYSTREEAEQALKGGEG